MPTAIVFPGQGSQRPQMAVPWRDHASARRWREASDILGWDVARLGTEAEAAELREPANCQVALFVHGTVILEAWNAAGVPPPVAVAGHSLGEYNALVAAGVLSFADGLRLVHARATATQAAADQAPGTMVACLGFAVTDVQRAADEAGVHVANDNAPGQVTVAGTPEGLERLENLLAEAGGKVRDVNVGAAYHSPHMRAAVPVFGEVLDAAVFHPAQVPVVANVDAKPHTDAAEWPALLRTQLTAPVRWRESVGALVEMGVDQMVELGASPVLTSLAKRTDRSLGRRNVSVPDDLEET